VAFRRYQQRHQAVIFQSQLLVLPVDPAIVTGELALP
jgi:hypothetical protein